MEGKGYGKEEALRWLERQRRRQSEGAGISLAISDPGDGSAVGCVGLTYRPWPGAPPSGHLDPQTGQAGLLFAPDAGLLGLGYWVLQAARGRGLASGAVRLLVEWAFTAAFAQRIEALVDVDNIASKRVLERSGFTQDGRLPGYLPEPDGRHEALLFSRVR
jgi:RimJ/RimL family protein N-acetyltransferase